MEGREGNRVVEVLLNEDVPVCTRESFVSSVETRDAKDRMLACYGFPVIVEEENGDSLIKMTTADSAIHPSTIIHTGTIVRRVRPSLTGAIGPPFSSVLASFPSTLLFRSSEGLDGRDGDDEWLGRNEPPEGAAAAIVADGRRREEANLSLAPTARWLSSHRSTGAAFVTVVL